MPIQRKIVIEGFSFSKKDFKELKKIWKFIWDISNFLEVKGQSLYFYQLKKNDFNFKKYFPELNNYVKGLDNGPIQTHFQAYLVNYLTKISKEFLQLFLIGENPKILGIGDNPLFLYFIIKD